MISPKIGGVTLSDGSALHADHALAGGPSVLFDAVAVVVSEEGAAMLLTEAAAIDWLRDAFGHLKAMGYSSQAQPLLDKAGIVPDAGVLELDANGASGKLLRVARNHRVWDREPALRSPK